MITETIQYTNFNDEPASKIVNFHISEAVLMDHMSIRDSLDELTAILSVDHTLNMEEIQKIIDLVKFFMSISYGIKSTDGSTFQQDPIVGQGAIYQAFKDSAAYNSFMLSLFKDPDKCVEFIVNVLPTQLRKEAEKAAGPQLKAMAKKAEQRNRPDPGTRIVDEYTQPPETEETTTDEESVDFDDLLAQAAAADEAEADKVDMPKAKISRSQYEFAKGRLRENQVADFESKYEPID